MNCRKCHRQLKNPKSVQNGMGPVCYRKAMAEISRDNEEDHNPIISDRGSLQEVGAIVWRLPDGRLACNFEHRIVLHSPTGMECGYGGSGPADMALNILAGFVTDEEARKLHQRFKWDFIASMPKGGGTINANAIRQWITNQGE